MTAVRRLIVNADDFGLSAGVNRGIAQAHEHGILTSASLMVRAPQATAAAAHARAHPALSVGLHLDLEPWHYADDAWVAAYTAVDTDDAAEVGAEVAAQVERFCALVGCEPTHLDAHHHLHRADPARAIARTFGERFGIPVRDLTPGLRHEAGFYGSHAIGVEALCGLLRELPPGTSELGCHPALDDDSGSSYRAERNVETATLCDPRVRDTLREEGIALRSYRDWDD